ncbi:hypothetical protein BaRGS_00009394 [Batillaria attramentaria]|uniref:Uncharacterized protein n=1 Tax=Batillaria attramentaria TaxID=370345 RepID=A0ABD0LKE3_9CAEN
MPRAFALTTTPVELINQQKLDEALSILSPHGLEFSRPRDTRGTEALRARRMGTFVRAANICRKLWQLSGTCGVLLRAFNGLGACYRRLTHKS